jgi:hypothetical protein
VISASSIVSVTLCGVSVTATRIPPVPGTYLARTWYAGSS